MATEMQVPAGLAEADYFPWTAFPTPLAPWIHSDRGTLIYLILRLDFGSRNVGLVAMERLE
jgi:hypothetical protein